MPEIAIFEIYKAHASYDCGALSVQLFYPRNPREIAKKIPENLPGGIVCLENLLTLGYSEIATPKNPFRPADGGSLFVFKDNVLLCHRRDKGAPIHKMYQGIPGGYTDSLDSTFSEQGLLQTGLRESGEENLIITRDKLPWLVVPNDSRDYTLQAAQRLGLDFGNRVRYVDVQTMPSRDRLEVFYEDGEPIFSSNGKGFLDLQWEASTSFSLLQIRQVPLSSEEIYPIDAEGMTGKDGTFKHFNRESYLISLAELANNPWGTPLSNPRVFQTRIKNGTPEVYKPEYSAPFFGPDMAKVTHAHIFGPEDKLTTCLDGLGVRGFAGRKLQWELWKERCKLLGESMIPDEFLAESA